MTDLSKDAVIENLSARLRAVTEQKDGAYSERNQLVALLARMAVAFGWRAGVGQHPAEDTAWENDWRTILFIDLPTGQAAWHFHDSERHLLEGLPSYSGRWDGHTTAEKYARAKAVRPESVDAIREQLIRAKADLDTIALVQTEQQERAKRSDYFIGGAS